MKNGPRRAELHGFVGARARDRVAFVNAIFRKNRAGDERHSMSDPEMLRASVEIDLGSTYGM